MPKKDTSVSYINISGRKAPHKTLLYNHQIILFIDPLKLEKGFSGWTLTSMNMNEFVPSEFYLGQNYPNPFKDKTVIKYCVGYKTRIQLTVHNSEGMELEKIIDEVKVPGTYQIKFSAAADKTGKLRNLPDGYYFYNLVAGEYFNDKKWLCKNSL